MDEFLPSEIARLILGYLKEDGCMKSWNTFLEESPSLKEYVLLYKKGKIYTTNVNGKSLLEILSEYCSLKRNLKNKQTGEIENPEKSSTSELAFDKGKKCMAEEIVNGVDSTFEKHLPLNQGEKNYSPAINSAAEVIFCETANNIHDFKGKKASSDCGNNLHSNKDKSIIHVDKLNPLELKSNAVVEDVPQTDLFLTISDVCSLSNASDERHSFSNEMHSDVSNKGANVAFKNEINNNSFNEESLTKMEVLNMEMEDNNLKINSSLTSSSYKIKVEPSDTTDLFLCGNKSANESGNRKCDSNLNQTITDSLTGPCKDVSISGFSLPDIDKSIKVTAKPIEENNCMEFENSLKLEINVNDRKYIDKELEIIPTTSSNSIENSIQVDDSNNVNQMNNVVTLNSSNNQFGVTLAPNNYQLATINGLPISTVPTYILSNPLSGDFLIQNTAAPCSTILVNAPYNGVCLPLHASTDNNIQNPAFTSIDSTKVYENALMTAVSSANKSATLSEESGTEISTLDKNTKKNSNNRGACKQKLKNKIEKLKLSSTNKRYYPKRAPKRKLIQLFSSSPEKNIETFEDIVLETTTPSKSGHQTALELLSLITKQSEGGNDYESPEFVRKSSSKGPSLISNSSIPNERGKANNSDKKYESKKVYKEKGSTKKSVDGGNRICDKKMFAQKQNHSSSNKVIVNKSKKQRNQSFVKSNKKKIFDKANFETSNEMQSNHKRNKSKTVSKKFNCRVELQNLSFDDDIYNLRSDTTAQTENSVALNETKQCTQLSLFTEGSKNISSRNSQKSVKSNEKSSKQYFLKSKSQKTLKGEKNVKNLPENKRRINDEKLNRGAILRTYSKLTSVVNVKELENKYELTDEYSPNYLSRMTNYVSEIPDNIAKSPLPDKHSSTKACDTKHSVSTSESSNNQDSILETLLDSASSLLEIEGNSATVTESLFSFTQIEDAVALRNLYNNTNHEVIAENKRKLHKNPKCSETFEKNNKNDPFLQFSTEK